MLGGILRGIRLFELNFMTFYLKVVPSLNLNITQQPGDGARVIVMSYQTILGVILWGPSMIVVNQLIKMTYEHTLYIIYSHHSNAVPQDTPNTEVIS